MAWTYGPTSFANSEEAKSTFLAARLDGTLPADAAPVLVKIAGSYSSPSGPAFTISGSGEEGVNGSYSVSVP